MTSRRSVPLRNESLNYVLVPSEFGDVGLVWKKAADRASVQRILLPLKCAATEDLIRARFPSIKLKSCPAVEDLAEKMQHCLLGEPITLPLDLLALENCSLFQRRVLLAEYEVPHGSVTTYALIARYLGMPKGARAVGQALAHNPFPIVIPCHRAIASDGSLGGYQGGLAMKRRLLEMEGIQFSSSGRVMISYFYYDK